ncbi:putative ATPase [Oceanospirillum multiglobuliferum]|uniref:Replication-associated recombination protein A n=1 Tax=Oceanospirillum multiglobuliferum TaxID=64969 RepID=A0A1T4MHL3_9GAMM|nr:replication-associated recombination protein A [Oceanospirillum multiglobuliferum]OPX57020.1 recombination factor protein RarA [Oceanospirillum multiglobuliferum]SJZ66509.1 putative ATPase [Oceanospirillum multiglobuliferum]
MDLFSQTLETSHQPLAARMRPKTLDEYCGQQHLLSKDGSLRKAIERDQLHSMILWGPPGVGKTSLAKLIAELTQARFEVISAVLAGVKEIRAAVERAQQSRVQGQRTLLFVDEVHRFNKSQQDAFLPYVEDGTFVFIGATTENPSFELNNALLSRARVYLLKPLSTEVLVTVLKHALQDVERGLGEQALHVEGNSLQLLAQAADGDARRALNLLEIAADLAVDTAQGRMITLASLQEVLSESTRRMDKGGDLFYEQISALHKSVRGSSPDAALYWFCRMLDGGCDPLYIARRVVRMASEEIGNADPRALQLSLNAWDVQERLGSPEGELAIAQAIVYIACAPKSNAVYTAYKQARAHVQATSHYDVPEHLRNAPTALMREMGFGQAYRYAHDEPDAYAAGECYFPEALADTTYYQPVPRGLEQKIAQKLNWLAEQDRNSPSKRYDIDQQS